MGTEHGQISGLLAHFNFKSEIFDHLADFWSRLAGCREVAVLKDQGFFATTLPFSHT